ncbi:ankyrin repeat, SAM and basic leucine zipper domain-containing protein 1-like [Ostrea edulis]|uniref:ankyrin repeat, SAM and basic leucine zipper domain-containing protein 1-like n=1 Tax=Ostrea edulis TaxID=37623 RepID=UPI002094EF14|nr:ankyrin repeat, SAM and basic leucine zipper domain-containing protein 1-like [Ostrea edulis]
MAAPMNFCPGGAECDDDEFDDGFLFDCDDTNDEKSHLRTHEYSNGTTNHADRGGFGVPLSKSKSSKSENPKERKIKEAVTVGADDFRMAVSRGNLDAIKTFIEKGYNVNTVLKCGWTPLMYAANFAFPQIVKSLLDNGADPHHHKDTYTVLMAACGSTSNNEDNILQCVDYLLERGVKLNTHDRYHMSPLMYACREGRVKVVSRLLDKEANINKQDNRGWTSLSWAISKNHQGVVKLLVERGADTKKLHSDGQTAMDLAIAQDLQLVIKLLGGDTENSIGISANQNQAYSSCNGLPAHSSSGAPDLDSSKKAVIYGELELFLSGLGLSHLVQLFQDQQVEFDMFLRMTDEDLIKMGIQQIGIRKKILDGVHMVHKQDWEKGSLPTVPYNRKMSCSEAVAMAANISKHTKYLSSTIGYIADQITVNSPVLETQDGTTPKQLQKHCLETRANVEMLQKELTRLSSKLQKVFQKRNVDPPDLVTLPVNRKSRINYKRVLLVLGVCVPVGVVIFYSRDALLKRINQFVSE